MSKLPKAPPLEVIVEMKSDVINKNDNIDFQYLPGDLYSNLKDKLIATQIETEENYNNNNSTWADFLDENLDIVSKFTYRKSFKVKVKIKSISKFSPKIVIE